MGRMVEQPTHVPSGVTDKGARGPMLCSGIISPSLSNVLTIQNHKNRVKVEVQYFLILMHHNTSDINYKRSFKQHQ